MAPNPDRRFDVDWLRCLAVLLLVPFHSIFFTVPSPDSILTVAEQAGTTTFYVAAAVIRFFHMPLLFALSGVAAWYALQVRTAGQYVKERLLRLLIPAAFGLLTLVPAMTYLSRLYSGTQVSFWLHYAEFFRFNRGDFVGFNGGFTPAHLWFIFYLFIFSLLALPLFSRMSAAAQGKVVAGINSLVGRRLALLIPGILFPLAALPNILGDKNPIVYFLYFVAGFAIMTGSGFQKSVGRDLPLFGGLTLLLTTFLILVSPRVLDIHLPELLVGFVYQFDRWMFVLAILGLGQLLLTRGGRVLSYLAESAFPFYVLHLPINALVAFYVAKEEASNGLKYLQMVMITTALTFIAYEIARRVMPLRFLLGMKEWRSSVRSGRSIRSAAYDAAE